jgi:hypothetical protein
VSDLERAPELWFAEVSRTEFEQVPAESGLERESELELELNLGPEPEPELAP